TLTLAKVMPTSAGDRWNRWSRELRAVLMRWSTSFSPLSRRSALSGLLCGFGRASAGRNRSAAYGRATTHGAALWRVISQRPVAGAGLVPDGDVAGSPSPPSLHFRVVDLAIENVKDLSAVGVVEPDDLHRVERRQPHGRPTSL